ncbi:outer membrane beta-barrel protein [Algoriphagus jejuensis]|uniref:outer membrane beta-barrel protein n=1 Tax=Algoriphagus jejuensis TaxID=419934 RepID=UPI0031D57869
MKISAFRWQDQFGKFLLTLGLGLFLYLPSFGQVPLKKDYIVIADTALSQGVVRDIPAMDNTVIYFARSKKQAFQRLSVEEVSEFRISERHFFRKEIPKGGGQRVVFLEKLRHAVPEATLWKLNGETPVYYVETASGMEVLGTSYRETLAASLDNPLLVPLIELTKPNDLSLEYLSRTANTIEKPRTFSRIFVLTPFVGYSRQTVGLLVPDSSEEIKITGSSPALGVNGEAFLTFSRNLSLNVGLTWTQFDAQDFFVYEQGVNRLESDVYLDFTLLQVPVAARYYFDLEPNKWRLYGEVGYSYAIPSYDKLGVYQGKFELEEVVTSRKSFEMSDSFSGVSYGVGVERYLSKHRGLVFGLRQFKVSGDENEFVQGLTFQLGYKF